MGKTDKKMPAAPLTAQKLEPLIQSCQGLVRSLAWKIHQKIGGRVDLDDLIGYGQIGLAEAATRYDPSSDARFVSYAYYRIRGSILDGLNKLTWFDNTRYHRGGYETIAGGVLSDDADQHNQYADDPSGHAAWLADTSVRLSMVYLMTDAEGQDERSIDVADQSAAAPDFGVLAQEMSSCLSELVDALPDQPRQLIRATFYEGQSLQNAADALGISKSWASRLRNQTLRDLAEQLRDRGLGMVA